MKLHFFPYEIGFGYQIKLQLNPGVFTYRFGFKTVEQNGGKLRGLKTNRGALPATTSVGMLKTGWMRVLMIVEGLVVFLKI